MTDEWAGLLDEDETILWQGAPQPGFRLAWDDPVDLFFALVFMGFFAIFALKTDAGTATRWVFNVLLIGILFYQLVLVHFLKTYKRRNTHYTLTNKRAFVATFDVFKGKRLDSYPIAQSTLLSLKEGAFTTIDFATKVVTSGDSTTETTIGFENLTDGREVFALMRKVQEGMDAEGKPA